ncbi:MAG: hypothetical protein AABY22_11500 [Nanoarchaeota archaeon]
MEKLLIKLLEDVKTDKKALVLLKNTAVRTNSNFELASKLRDLEVKLFPETKEAKDAKKQAKELELLFRMVDLNIEESTCWKIAETLRQYNKMKGKFSIKESSKIIAKTKEIFDNE